MSKGRNNKRPTTFFLIVLFSASDHLFMDSILQNRILALRLKVLSRHFLRLSVKEPRMRPNESPRGALRRPTAKVGHHSAFYRPTLNIFLRPPVSILE